MSALLQKIERNIYIDYIKNRFTERIYAGNCLFTRIYPNESFCGVLDNMKDKVIPHGLTKVQIYKHAIVENDQQLCLSILGVMQFLDHKLNFTHQIVGNKRDPIEITIDSLTIFEFVEYEKPLAEFPLPPKAEVPKQDRQKNGSKDNKQRNDRRGEKRYDSYQTRQTLKEEKFKPYEPK